MPVAVPPAAPEGATAPQGAPLSRRALLGYTASAPGLSMGLGLAAAPSAARAAPLPLTPPDPVDTLDIADLGLQFAAPTMPLVALSLGRDGVYTFQMPRLDQGTGIATALAMMIAEEAQVTLDKVKVLSGDAHPELAANQITGGSATIRASSRTSSHSWLRRVKPRAGRPAPVRRCCLRSTRWWASRPPGSMRWTS